MRKIIDVLCTTNGLLQITGDKEVLESIPAVRDSKAKIYPVKTRGTHRVRLPRRYGFKLTF